MKQQAIYTTIFITTSALAVGCGGDDSESPSNAQDAASGGNAGDGDGDTGGTTGNGDGDTGGTTGDGDGDTGGTTGDGDGDTGGTIGDGDMGGNGGNGGSSSQCVTTFGDASFGTGCFE